ncbi:MAG: alpha/beta fold hydrolase [Elusimicrobia bacterium]|nr:alpha/beta fold hydrolase [Elusimicrobiota bacterium]
MKAPAWGTELGYEDRGGSGVPLVLIHAFPLDRRMWEPQAPLAARARLIAYDVRGFGESPGGDGQYPFELLVDDLLGLLDHLKLPSAILCGLSMGGYLALRAAERAPERVRGLILADTKSEADGDEAKLKRAAALLAIKRGGLAPFADGFLKGALSPKTLAERPQVAERVRGLILDNAPSGVCAALLAMAARTDTTAALARLSLPALVLVGEHDALTPPDAARALSAALKGSRLELLPAAGHLSNLENPAAFNAAVSRFL